MRRATPPAPTRVVLATADSKGPKGFLVGRIGINVRLNYDELDGLGPYGLSDVDIDLLHVVAATKLADRGVKRRGASRGRVIQVVVPVHDPGRWSARELYGALVEAIEFVTGDSWSFVFVQRHPHVRTRALSFLRGLSPPTTVIPYSGGLDSYATLKLISKEAPGSIALVTLGAGRAMRDLVRLTSGKHAESFHQIGFPIGLRIGRYCEPSARSRTFQFFAVTALAARLLGANHSVIPENGQGSLGPSIVGYGGEFPYRGTSPAFSNRVYNFLLALWGVCPPFVHPHLWSTKGQMLQRLARDGLLDGWMVTRSCARHLSRKKKIDRGVECGVCANCLLSRLPLHTAGVRWAAHAERYLWGNFCAPSLASAVDRQKYVVETNQHDEDIAYSAVAIHEDLAAITNESQGNPAVEQLIYELGKALRIEPEPMRKKVSELIQTHRNEWRSFVDDLPRDSWVRHLTGGG